MKVELIMLAFLIKQSTTERLQVCRFCSSTWSAPGGLKSSAGRITSHIKRQRGPGAISANGAPVLVHPIATSKLLRNPAAEELVRQVLIDATGPALAQSPLAALI